MGLWWVFFFLPFFNFLILFLDVLCLHIGFQFRLQVPVLGTNFVGLISLYVT